MHPLIQLGVALDDTCLLLIFYVCSLYTLTRILFSGYVAL